MRIFIDESGAFTGENNVSAVGALVIPDQNFAGFEKLYSRLRKTLPKERGEVKGRLLKEHHVREVVSILKRTGCIFETVVVDSNFQTKQEIIEHKKMQEEKITEHLTDLHHDNVIRRVNELRSQLEKTSIPLYIQSCAMAELIYNTLFNANIYYSFRLARELGAYRWIVDAKDRERTTPWEDWWSIVVFPMIESKSFKAPFAAVEGGDYRWHDRFKTEASDYKKQFMTDPDKGETFELRPILRDFRFSWKAENGLEAVDILVNTVRRALAGNFGREGWLPVRELMIHLRGQYIRLISLAPEGREPPQVPYARVLSDFSSGGRAMLPPRA